MPSSRNCVIGSLIAVVIAVVVGIGIYFVVSKKDASDPNDGATAKLLIKSSGGTVKLYDHQFKTFVDARVNEMMFGIVSFGSYLNETIYYATTESNSVIRSTNNELFPDLPAFTADWIKTAIAVDDVTRKVYVVDRTANQIRVVDKNYHNILPLKLTEPKDVFLAAESGKMLVLEKSKIIMADMDGANGETLVNVDNIQAMTVDTTNGILYFAHQKGISSYDYSKSKKQAVVNAAETQVQSLAYKDNALYFINKKGKSFKSPRTSLDNCRLDESQCAGQCCRVFSVYENDKLEQVKIYKSDKPQTKNPCETKNGDCQHLCLLNSSEEGRSCACDKGWTLQSDNKNCEKVT